MDFTAYKNLLTMNYFQTTVSLGALVPNSRVRHEKQWRPDFTHHKTHPKSALFEKKQTEVHF